MRFSVLIFESPVVIPKPNKRHIHTHTCTQYFSQSSLPYESKIRDMFKKKKKKKSGTTYRYVSKDKIVLSPQPVSCSRQTISTLPLLWNRRAVLLAESGSSRSGSPCFSMCLLNTAEDRTALIPAREVPSHTIYFSSFFNDH